MFELNQLRCFVAVAEELHFGRAAARLHITQPPLSRQIQLLEHHLEAQLFERTNRSVRLTPAGRHFLPEARRVLRLAESAALVTRRMARGEAGSVAIGFTAASGYDFVPRLISDLRRRLPSIDVVLKEMVTIDQIEALASSRIDLGLLRPPVNRRDFDAICVLREPLVLALPSDHPLLSRRTLRLAEVVREPFITYSPYEAKYFHDLIAGVFHNAGATPRFVQHITQIHSVLALVGAGLGVALVPRSAEKLRFSSVAFRTVTGVPDDLVELFAVWRPDNDNPALRAILRSVAERSRD